MQASPLAKKPRAAALTIASAAAAAAGAQDGRRPAASEAPSGLAGEGCKDPRQVRKGGVSLSLFPGQVSPCRRASNTTSAERCLRASEQPASQKEGQRRGWGSC
ncbi:Hypothetical predicted protein [Podarcis lilfordi]|uniref:Uncharacterized protein n=1 Tax=Podarcis lilfordi TaxID=74358 RepID=A0AA35PW51_9SAUR|nr:Hypothetical predicted protein [Podarcis lilfordi]